MPLIKSISGIRGTIGGKSGQGLNPIDIARYTCAYAQWLKEQNPGARCRAVVGRDARISGPMVSQIIQASLMGSGVDVIDLNLATTPTVEMAVIHEKAHGGIIITASHNPRQWNALKLLNHLGEFLSNDQGARVLSLADSNQIDFPDVDNLGTRIVLPNSLDNHIEAILALPLVDSRAISAANLSVVIDCVNSVGGVALPPLLRALGVKQVHELYTVPNGEFPHNPEPLPEHLTEISAEVMRTKANLGFVVDPDVDRLAIICEDGSMFGEEYTLVAVADYVLTHTPGNTVSNLSSTAALRDVTLRHGGIYTASAVGEVNVVAQMKATNAVIGGEGNGGVIYPPLHYGRDALVGIALFLSHYVKMGLPCSHLRSCYPNYFMSKNRIDIDAGTNPADILDRVKAHFAHQPLNDADGLRIDFPGHWVHLRQSNTEPIIRVYAESGSAEQANKLASDMMGTIRSLM